MMTNGNVDLKNFVPMRLVCEFFVAASENLPPAFPGWLSPLSAPVRRQLRNPFTGELIFNQTGEPYIVETFEPEGPWNDVRCPNLKTFQSTDLAPIGQLEIDTLAEILVPSHANATVYPLFAPPSSGWNLAALSPQFTHALAAVSSVEDVANSWIAALRANSAVDSDLIASVDLSSVIVRLRELARSAISQDCHLHVYQGPQPSA